MFGFVIRPFEARAYLKYSNILIFKGSISDSPTHTRATRVPLRFDHNDYGDDCYVIALIISPTYYLGICFVKSAWMFFGTIFKCRPIINM